MYLISALSIVQHRGVNIIKKKIEEVVWMLDDLVAFKKCVTFVQDSKICVELE